MKKILVVDDDADILDLMRMLLSMHHYEVMTVARAGQVDDAIAKFSPDLIILDVSLGDADGRDICKRLKDSPETSFIPIILFSANPEFQNDYIACKANAFIAKPFDLTELLKNLEAQVGVS